MSQSDASPEGMFAVVGIGYEGEVDERGEPVYHGLLTVLASHDALGTESITLDDTALPTGAWTTDEWDTAAGMVNRLTRVDEHYWPPFNPHPAAVVDGRIVKLYVHAQDPDNGFVAQASARYGLAVEKAE